MKPRDAATHALQTNMCPKCNSQHSKIIFSGKDYLHNLPGEFYVSRCSDCRLLFQNPSPPPERIQDYYPPSYGPHLTIPDKPVSPPEIPAPYRKYLSESLGYRHLAVDLPDTVSFSQKVERTRAGIDLVPHFIKGGKILEIGCATGDRLDSLRRLGWESLYGIEFIHSAARHAGQRGFNVEAGPVEDLINQLRDNTFDVVVASMVLEHLYNPFEVTRAIAAKLKPGGEFLFSTIVCDSLDAKIFGPYFAGFDYPRHLVHFRKKDVLDMLADRFEQVEVFHQNAPIDYVRSASWRLKPRSLNMFDRFIKKYGQTGFVYRIGERLAEMGLTCRVSFRCRRTRNP